MTLHLVLDHSALIPCGSKPPEDKEALLKIASILHNHDVVWYVSARYLKTLNSKAKSKWNRGCPGHPLPPLLRGLKNTLYRLVVMAYTHRRLHCSQRELEQGLRLHILGRTLENSRGIQIPTGIVGEDREVYAIALRAKRLPAAHEVYIVTADTPFYDKIRQHGQITPLRPRELLELLG